MRKLDAQISVGRVASLRQLGEMVGLQFKIETDQYLERRFVLSSDRRKPTYWRRQLGLEHDLDPVVAHAVPLPQEQIDRAHPLSRPFLMGNVVLMPRTCEEAVFVEPPVATSFFIVGCFPHFSGKPLPEKLRSFLLALAAYMSTRTFRYLCFVNSRRMTIDRANAELSAVLELPWPFGGLESDDWRQFLKAGSATRDAIVCEMLGLPLLYQKVVAEFDSFRERFADGGTPPDAMRPSEDEQLEAYVGALLHEVGGTRQRYQALTVPLDGDLLATIIQYRLNGDCLSSEEAAQFVGAATDAYARQGASALTQSRYLWHSPEAMTSVLIKPRQRLHWTLERAFADADLVTAAAMSGMNGKAAA